MRGCSVGGKVHELEPYTLMMYRGGPLTCSDAATVAAKVVTLAVEAQCAACGVSTRRFANPAEYLAGQAHRGHLRPD